jgi:hypothetical protein
MTTNDNGLQRITTDYNGLQRTFFKKSSSLHSNQNIHMKSRITHYASSPPTRLAGISCRRKQCKDGSGDTAFARMKRDHVNENSHPHESGVTLRFPPSQGQSRSVKVSQGQSSLVKVGQDVAAGIPACRRAGLPSPAEKTLRKSRRIGILASSRPDTSFPGGRNACATMDQSRSVNPSQGSTGLIKPSP